MEKDSLFQIVCECCGAKIDVDPRTRSVFHIEAPGRKKRNFDEVVEDVDRGATAAICTRCGDSEPRPVELDTDLDHRAEVRPDVIRTLG